MMLKPVIPFEPVSTDAIPTGSNWTAQVKWDGVRVLTYYDGTVLRLFNRRLHERTGHYPELQNVNSYCSAKSIILDGEIIALNNGRPSFYKVMQRDGITRLSNLDMLQKNVPIDYMIFDVLYANGDWVVKEPLTNRQELLQRFIKPNGAIHLVDNFTDSNALYKAIETQQMEGIVIKDASSSYMINGKDGRWKKKKFYRDLIAVVGGITLRNSVVNALLLGLFDDSSRLWYIGHAGTGRLTQKDWENITGVTRPLVQAEMPFVNRPSRIKQAVWLKPSITVKVKYAEWAEGHMLRQPSIQALVDIPAYECLME